MRSYSYFLIQLSIIRYTQSWVPSKKVSFRCRPSPLHVCSVHGQRTNIQIPLLDWEESELAESTVIPLPSTHLPDEMTTLNVYGMRLTRPVHQLIMDDALSRGETNESELNGIERVFGQIVHKPDPESLVGAIGCAADVLLINSDGPEEEGGDSSGDGDTPSKTVLIRGSYRFVVKEIVKTIPFPVAVVDELVDNDDGTSILQESELPLASDDDSEDDSPPQLAKRCMSAMRTYLDQQLEASVRDMSPLEQSIIEDSENGLGLSVQRQAAEEAAAVYEVFDQYLIDLCPTPTEMYFSIAFMAAEMANMENEVRRKMLVMMDGTARLRYVTELLEEMVGMARARKMANSITNEADEDSRDLKVGTPQLPPWAKSIDEGTLVEYYWNEEEGWCEGKVVEKPMMIVDELILTIEFVQDGEVHRLPFSPDEKVRWRPVQ